LYAKGMTTREISATFKEMYDADVSATLVSRVTDAVIDKVTEWSIGTINALFREICKYDLIATGHFL